MDKQPILFVVSSTGGHGRNDANEKYDNILKDEFNIVIVWKIANSLETNILGIGT